MVSLIACVDKNGGLGKDGKLLYHIPEDLAFLKALTMGKYVIVGRKTLDGLPKSFLKNVIPLVLSHKEHPEYRTFHSKKSMVKWVGHYDFMENLDIWVLGGAAVYNVFYEEDMVDYVFLGEHLGEPKEADTFFPMDLIKGAEKQTIYKTKDYEFNCYKI